MEQISDYKRYPDGVTKCKYRDKENGGIYWHKKGTDVYRRFRSDDDTWPQDHHQESIAIPRTLPARPRERRESRTSDRPSAERSNDRERSPSARRRTGPTESSRDAYDEQLSSPTTGQYYQLASRQGTRPGYSRSRDPDETHFREPDKVISSSSTNEPTIRSYHQMSPSNLFPALNLPDDALEFIQIAMNDFRACATFISRNRKFISSARTSWFEDAAAEAMKDRNPTLIQQCLHRRVILNQFKATSEEKGQTWLRLLAEKEPRAIRQFYDAVNGLAGIVQARTKTLPTHSVPSAPPTSYPPGPGTTPITSDRPFGSLPPMSPPPNNALPESSRYSSRYPVPPSPFDRQGVGQPGVSSFQPASSTSWPRPSASGDRMQPDISAPAYLYQPHPIAENSNAYNQMSPPNWQPSSTNRPSEIYTSRLLQRRNSQSTNTFQGPGALSSPLDPSQDTTASSQTEDDLRTVLSTIAARRTNRVSASQFGDPERLDPRYKLRNGKFFFVKGCVFAMMYPEPKGESRGNRNQLDTGPDDSTNIIKGPKGQKIFSHIKRFVVIRGRKGYCLCVPINSYRGTGVGKKQIPPDEKSAHAIIYDSRERAPRPIIPGEEDLVKTPIAVDMNPDDTLDDTSRIHFGKIYTIEWNVKVCEIGRIASQSVKDVDKYWREELMREVN